MIQPEQPQFSHLDAHNQPTMVDISAKQITQRLAVAEGRVLLPPEVLALLQAGDIQTKKGAVFQTAIIAGTMAAKKTADLIPFCHPISLERCHLSVALDEAQVVVIRAEVGISAKTGVEMEALTAVSVAALTVYDMCKGVSPHIEIQQIRLLQKTGGKTIYEAR
jgi:cyclic pyranopterin phosphate synthase